MEDMFDSVWSVVTPTLTAIITGIISWLSTKTKYQNEIRQMQAQIEDSQIDNLNKAMCSYDDLMKRYTTQIKELIQEIETVRKENKVLRENQYNDNEKIDELLRENKSLRKEVEELKEQVRLLASQISNKDKSHSGTSDK